VLADRLDAPGQVHAPNGDLGFAQPKRWDNDADQVGQAGHEVPDAPVQAGRVHPDQDLVVLGDRLVDVLELENLGRAVGVLDDGLHGGLAARCGSRTHVDCNIRQAAGRGRMRRIHVHALLGKRTRLEADRRILLNVPRRVTLSLPWSPGQAPDERSYLRSSRNADPFSRGPRQLRADCGQSLVGLALPRRKPSLDEQHRKGDLEEATRD
jgi:hypothetical protein